MRFISFFPVRPSLSHTLNDPEPPHITQLHASLCRNFS